MSFGTIFRAAMSLMFHPAMLATVVSVLASLLDLGHRSKPAAIPSLVVYLNA
jgi:hypothetical protein